MRMKIRKIETQFLKQIFFRRTFERQDTKFAILELLIASFEKNRSWMQIRVQTTTE